MKRILNIAIIALLAVSIALPALAEGQTSLSGEVIHRETLTLTAPFGGKILDLTAREGDLYQAGDALLELDTVKLYAPCDGTVGGLRIVPGDEAAFIQEQYGALLYIEPASAYTIETNTDDAYDSNENRMVHVGETVYLVSVNSKKRTGTGFVTSVDGKSYAVEVAQGNLRVNEKAYIYRSEDYDYKSRIGSGKTLRNNPIPLTGEGSVLKVWVKEGEEIRRGDLIAELVTGTLSQLREVSAQVTAPEDGVLASLSVAPGDSVEQGQALATFYPLKSMQIAAVVNETDLSAIAPGDEVTIELLGLKDRGPFAGTVSAISAVNRAESGDAEYVAYVDFEPDVLVREGMTATVYLNH